VLLALAFPRMVPPRGAHHDEKQKRRAFDLLKEAALRRTLIMSGVALTGIELFSFYMPVYGQSIGFLPRASAWCSAPTPPPRRGASGDAGAGEALHRSGVLTGSLFIATATYALFPFLSGVPMLVLTAFLLGLGLARRSRSPSC